MNEFVCRNVAVVAVQILNIIPEKEVNFRNDIHKFIDNQRNKAPEVLKSTYSWTEFDSIIKSYIPTTISANNEWKKQIINIYTNSDK